MSFYFAHFPLLGLGPGCCLPPTLLSGIKRASATSHCVAEGFLRVFSQWSKLPSHLHLSVSAYVCPHLQNSLGTERSPLSSLQGPSDPIASPDHHLVVNALPQFRVCCRCHHAACAGPIRVIICCPPSRRRILCSVCSEAQTSSFCLTVHVHPWNRRVSHMILVAGATSADCMTHDTFSTFVVNDHSFGQIFAI